MNYLTTSLISSSIGEYSDLETSISELDEIFSQLGGKKQSKQSKDSSSDEESSMSSLSSLEDSSSDFDL